MNEKSHRNPPEPFSRRRIKVLPALSLVLGLAYAVESDLTMTTYYPAPSGVYKKLITTADTILARDGGNVGIGTSIPPTTTSTKLNVVGGTVLTHIE